MTGEQMTPVQRVQSMVKLGVPLEDAVRLIYGDQLAKAEAEIAASPDPAPLPEVRAPEPAAEDEWPELSFRCRVRHAAWIRETAEFSGCSTGQVIAWCVAQQYAAWKTSKPIGSATDDTPGQRRSFTRDGFKAPAAAER